MFNLAYNLILSVGFIGIGFLCLTNGYSMFDRQVKQIHSAIDSVGWPSSKGTVIGSVIKSRTIKTGESGRAEYKTEIRYEYAVHGRSYVSDIYSLASSGYNFDTDRSVAINLSERYPMGSKLDVHYNPMNPSEGLVQPGVEPRAIDRWPISVFLMGIGLIGFGLIPLLQLAEKKVAKQIILIPMLIAIIALSCTLLSSVIYFFGPYFVPALLTQFIPKNAIIKTAP